MNQYLKQLSAQARSAVPKRQWQIVDACAREILAKFADEPEGHFLSGLVARAANQPQIAESAFRKTLEVDAARYDAAIELAYQLSTARRNGEAAELVRRYQVKLDNSPLYLNMAGTVYNQVGLPEQALPLFLKANELQPGIDMFQGNLASCYVFLGNIAEAKRIYERLLERMPSHQRNHLTYAGLEKATDHTHIERMKEILDTEKLPSDRNIFMYYAIGKELEDLEEWDEAFEYFKKAGDAVCSVANYDINTDLKLIDTVIEVCNADWMHSSSGAGAKPVTSKTPIFIVGLPRTGTTLADRILASHSQVQSVGETQFMQMVIRRHSGIESEEKMTPEMLAIAAGLDPAVLGKAYMEMLGYRLPDEPFFIDKLPFNILYLGFIIKAFPGAKIVRMKRNPLDSCFAMYKQVFTWAYKFSYDLDLLGRYYVAHNRLVEHWQETLGDRFIELEYESLVAGQENHTRILLDRLGLEFEEACLNFDKNKSATTTASSVQVREKIHARSVNRWKNYERQLQPLKDYLENAGIVVE